MKRDAGERESFKLEDRGRFRSREGWDGCGQERGRRASVKGQLYSRLAAAGSEEAREDWSLGAKKKLATEQREGGRGGQPQAPELQQRVDNSIIT